MIEGALVSAVYGSAVAYPATFVDASGGTQAVRVLLIRDSDDVLQAGDLAARGVSSAVRVRRSELPNKPRRGDRFIVDGVDYDVDSAEKYQAFEWVAYAI